MKKLALIRTAVAGVGLSGVSVRGDRSGRTCGAEVRGTREVPVVASNALGRFTARLS